jgi:hypothetical protein
VRTTTNQKGAIDAKVPARCSTHARWRRGAARRCGIRSHVLRRYRGCRARWPGRRPTRDFGRITSGPVVAAPPSRPGAMATALARSMAPHRAIAARACARADRRRTGHAARRGVRRGAGTAAPGRGPRPATSAPGAPSATRRPARRRSRAARTSAAPQRCIRASRADAARRLAAGPRKRRILLAALSGPRPKRRRRARRCAAGGTASAGPPQRRCGLWHAGAAASCPRRPPGAMPARMRRAGPTRLTASRRCA